MNMFLSVLSISCILLSVKSSQPALQSTKPAIPALDPNGWMGQLDGNKLISQINIPGTHDSMAMDMQNSLADCNAYSISQQLSFGYRMFDLRVVWDEEKGRLWMHHGPKPTRFGWDDFHNAAKEFLTAHPTECIIAIVKNARTNFHGRFYENLRGHLHSLFAEKFSSTLSNYAKKPGDTDNIYYFGNEANKPVPIPAIKQCAGKVVILPDGEDNQKQWREDPAWEAISPVQYDDIYIGEKLYEKKEEHYVASWYVNNEQRRKWFHDDLQKAMETGGGTEKKFYRIPGNTNSAKQVDFTCGKPYAWSKWLNPYIYREVLDNSFSTTTKTFDKCTPKFYGAILIDIPKKNKPILYNEEIAKAIIMSNCELWDKVNHGPLSEQFKNDYNKLPADYVAEPEGYTKCRLAFNDAHSQYDDIGFDQGDENDMEEYDDNDMEDDNDDDIEEDDDQYVYPLYPMSGITRYAPNPSKYGLIAFSIFSVGILLFCLMISFIAGGIAGVILAHFVTHFIHNNKSVDKDDDNTEYENV